MTIVFGTNAKPALVAAAILVLSPMHNGTAWAAKLPTETCDALEKELTELEKAGAVADFRKGANTGRIEFDNDRLKRVARFIEVEESLMFRCTGRRQLLQLREDPPDPAIAEAAAEAAKAAADNAAADKATAAAPEKRKSVSSANKAKRTRPSKAREKVEEPSAE